MLGQLGFAWVLLGVTMSTAVVESHGKPSLGNSLRLADMVPGEQESVTIHGNESLTVCGGAEWQLAPHCMQYQYKASHTLDTFVVEKTVYQAIQGERRVVDEDAMIQGSRCLADECMKKVELESGSWCLVMANMDPQNRATNVEFDYTSCLSEDDQNIVILVLLGVIGGLVALLCICSCICCCIFPCKKKGKTGKDSSQMTATVQYHPQMGWYQDPYQEVYLTPQYAPEEQAGLYHPLLEQQHQPYPQQQHQEHPQQQHQEQQRRQQHQQ